MSAEEREPAAAQGDPEAVRQTRRIEELERKTAPAELSRALSRDARERGI